MNILLYDEAGLVTLTRYSASEPAKKLYDNSIRIGISEPHT